MLKRLFRSRSSCALTVHGRELPAQVGISRVFQKRGLQNLVRTRASLWPGFVRNLRLVSVPGFTVGDPNLMSGQLSH